MALSVREHEFVIASHAIGASPKRIVLRHMLPNIADGLIVLATLETAQLVIAEAALSYLGLGVSARSPSWGSMLADGRNYVQTSWLLSTVPGPAIFATVLSINLVGTSLRESGGRSRRKRRAKATVHANSESP
jgi:peptide/nickel transport system permease protein